MLNKIPDEREVQLALGCMSPFKTTGPDGIDAFFLQKNWHHIKGSIMTTVKDAFSGRKFDSKMADSLMVLIPKTL